jgi:hypothetical protein
MTVGAITFMLIFMKRLSVYAERTSGRLDTWGGFLLIKKSRLILLRIETLNNIQKSYGSVFSRGSLVNEIFTNN